jgi:hypothetical protein
MPSDNRSDPERRNEVPVEDLDDDPEAPLYSTVPLETDHGVVVIQQQNVGPDNEAGGGEWPDPHTAPRLPAPGAADEDSGDEDEEPPERP